MKLFVATIAVGLLWAVSINSAASAASRVQGGAAHEKRCWPGNKYGNNDIGLPKGASDNIGHRKYATCNDCRPSITGTKCDLWFGGQTADGGKGGLATHDGWPGITGVHWQVIENSNQGEKIYGTELNDELLGRNGSDTLRAGKGNNVIWGDSNIALNGTKQHDVLTALDGNNWVYTSKGYNMVRVGKGRNHVFAYNGHGSIFCGGSKTVVTVLKKSRYHLHGCHHVRHPG